MIKILIKAKGGACNSCNKTRVEGMYDNETLVIIEDLIQHGT